MKTRYNQNSSEISGKVAVLGIQICEYSQNRTCLESVILDERKSHQTWFPFLVGHFCLPLFEARATYSSLEESEAEMFPSGPWMMCLRVGSCLYYFPFHLRTKRSIAGSLQSQPYLLFWAWTVRMVRLQLEQARYWTLDIGNHIGQVTASL
jgi:hypothetical protein